MCLPRAVLLKPSVGVHGWFLEEFPLSQYCSSLVSSSIQTDLIKRERCWNSQTWLRVSTSCSSMLLRSRRAGLITVGVVVTAVCIACSTAFLYRQIQEAAASTTATSATSARYFNHGGEGLLLLLSPLPHGHHLLLLLCLTNSMCTCITCACVVCMNMMSRSRIRFMMCNLVYLDSLLHVQDVHIWPARLYLYLSSLYKFIGSAQVA